MNDLTPICSTVASGSREIDRAVDDVAACRAKLATIVAEARDAEGELERLLELEGEDHVQRVLHGPDTAPEKPKRRTRIMNLQERIAALHMARPVQERICRDAVERERSARATMAADVVPHLAELRLQALANCERPLNELLGALVDAAAIDTIQDTIAGREFAVLPNVPVEGLFRASSLLDKFKAGLPPRLQQLLDPRFQKIEPAVAAAASEMMKVLSAPARN